ncbi:unknown [Tannerella sp. CAG:118]|uniref:Uncharacterized protein n=1 Tax=Coprobacter secundus subsp. similis TaxID=2751153 RepID=A0A7G1HZC0_9BACT|nr:hypothetical protein Cop2CBH44_27360 [Coprobacter secundus subsp. similis]CCY38496.1 unknown [Tannerella sp. CAG:118]
MNIFIFAKSLSNKKYKNRNYEKIPFSNRIVFGHSFHIM